MLEKVQRRFTRMVPGLRDLGYGERLGVLGLMTLEERRNRSDMMEMFKVLKGLSAIPVETFFELNGNGRTRGNSMKIIKWSFKRTSGSFSSPRESSTDGTVSTKGLFLRGQWTLLRRDYKRNAKRRWIFLWVIDPHDPKAACTWTTAPVPGGQTRYKPGIDQV